MHFLLTLIEKIFEFSTISIIEIRFHKLFSFVRILPIELYMWLSTQLYDDDIIGGVYDDIDIIIGGYNIVVQVWCIWDRILYWGVWRYRHYMGGYDDIDIIIGGMIIANIIGGMT